MRNRLLPTLLLCALAHAPLARSNPSPSKTANRPLAGAHAHNDYEHPRPLLDALSHGFQSVEADIFLIDDQLLVAHDREDVTSERTLQSLYLDPLLQRVRQNSGQVYPQGKLPFYLLIDLKSEGESTYRALHQTLQGYQEMLTEFLDNRIHNRAVTVIVSGNRPRELMANLHPRLAGYDGRLGDLKDANPLFTPWISDNWQNHFQWRGEGPVPPADRKKLRQLVTQAHANNVQLRLWAIPDHSASWALMKAAGVDFINTDRLAELSAFLQK